jgi:hypothetical protein
MTDHGDLDALVTELNSGAPKARRSDEQTARLRAWLGEVTARSASDLLLVPGAPPSLRERGWFGLAVDRTQPEIGAITQENAFAIQHGASVIPGNGLDRRLIQREIKSDPRARRIPFGERLVILDEVAAAMKRKGIGT